MPAAAIKGIIISISIIAALGVAVLENPQIQEWLEEQRKRIAELLRSIGEELDPASRRAAEAFAYGGRTPATDLSLRREASGSQDAVAIATGSSTGLATAMSEPVRRPEGQVRMNADEAEERRRKGREYLAKRNQQMFELRQRRKTANEESAATKPPTPISFDEMVDKEGMWWVGGGEMELTSSDTTGSLPAQLEDETKDVAKALSTPSSAAEADMGSEGWKRGFEMANPFGDEYALSRSDTPKPPVPPKIKLDGRASPSLIHNTPDLPGSFPSHAATEPSPNIDHHDEMSFEEQMAIALSLSEAEGQASSTKAAYADDSADDAELKAAIEASLKEMEEELATSPARTAAASISSVSQAVPKVVERMSPKPCGRLFQPAPRSQWETAFDPEYSPTREPLYIAPSESNHDELYSVTPQLGRSNLALGRLSGSSRSSEIGIPPYDRPLGFEQLRNLQPATDANALEESNFYSAHSSTFLVPHQTTTTAANLEPEVPLIDMSEDSHVRERMPTATVRELTLQLHGDSDSPSDSFGSLHGDASRTVSRASSRTSDVEAIDVVIDSDVDLLSEEGDGIATPDSWTEVGSQDGESEGEAHPLQFS